MLETVLRTWHIVLSPLIFLALHFSIVLYMFHSISPKKLPRVATVWCLETNMPDKANGLTDAKIRGLQTPASGREEWSDHIVPGLRLRVDQSGKKTFILRKRVGERRRNITIGPYKEYFGLTDAKKRLVRYSSISSMAGVRHDRPRKMAPPLPVG
jgi:hypothetical protein